MSYYFAVVLKDSLLFGCDRTFNNKETGENRSDSRRYSILGNNRVFLPTGNLAFCVRIQNFIHNIFGFSLEAFEGGDSEYSKFLSSQYQKVKEDNISRLKAIGKTAYTETDCLYGGFDYDGTPFIITISYKDDFQLKLVNKPPQYVCLNQSPKVLTLVKGLLHNFIGATEGVEEDRVWELGKRFLPQIIQKISKVDSLVSATGDLIFLSSKGVQTYEF